MKARDWYALAEQLSLGETEAHWRTAANRAYYYLFIEAREFATAHLGLSATKLRYHERPHRYLVDYLSSKASTQADAARASDIVSLSVYLRMTRDIRHHADYDLERSFNQSHVEQALRMTQSALQLIENLR